MTRAVIFAVVALAGCYKTTLLLAPVQPAYRSPVHDDDLHVSVGGVVELSPPVELSDACAPGAQPVAIEERVGALGAFADLVLGEFLPFVDVFNTSVDCALTGPPGALSMRRE